MTVLPATDAPEGWPEGPFRTQDPRAIPCERQAGWVAAAISALALAAGMGLWVLLGEPSGAGLIRAGGASTALLLALTWHWQRWPAISWRHTRYRVSAEGLEIHSGVVWRSVVNVPRERIQHTDVNQGPIERRWGLATLTVHTAGDEHSAIALDGIEHGEALGIRDDLLGTGAVRGG